MLLHPVKAKLIIFDADGTLRRCIDHKGPCHSDERQWEVIPGVEEVLAQYAWGDTVEMAIATNQGGIELGHRSMQSCYKQLNQLLINTLCIPYPRGGVHVCPHYTTPCFCRKPAPGMLFAAIERLKREGFDLTLADDVLFVGDSHDDAMAAARAGIAFLSAEEFFGRRI